MALIQIFLILSLGLLVIGFSDILRIIAILSIIPYFFKINFSFKLKLNKKLLYYLLPLILLYPYILLYYRLPLTNLNVVENLKTNIHDLYFYLYNFVLLSLSILAIYMDDEKLMFTTIFMVFYLLSSLPLYMYLFNFGVGYGFDDAIYTGLYKKYFLNGAPLWIQRIPHYSYTNFIKNIYYCFLGLPHYSLIYLLQPINLPIQFLNILPSYLLFLFLAPLVIYKTYGKLSPLLLLCITGILFEPARGKPYTLSILFLIIAIYFFERRKYLSMFLSMFLSFISHYLVGVFLGIYILGRLLKGKYRLFFIQLTAPLPFFVFLVRKLMFPEVVEIGEVSFIPNPLEFVFELIGLRIIYLNNINPAHTFFILALWYSLLVKKDKKWELLAPILSIHLSQCLLGSINWLTIQAYHRRIQTVLDIMLIPIAIGFIDDMAKRLRDENIYILYKRYKAKFNLRILLVLFLASLPLINFYYTYSYPYAYPMIPLPPYYKSDIHMVYRIERMMENESFLVQSSAEFLCCGVVIYGLGIYPHIYDPWLKGIRTSYIDMLNCTDFNLNFSAYNYRYVIIVLEENRTKFYLQLFKINHTLPQIFRNIERRYYIVNKFVFDYGYAKYHLFMVRFNGN